VWAPVRGSDPVEVELVVVATSDGGPVVGGPVVGGPVVGGLVVGGVVVGGPVVGGLVVVVVGRRGWGAVVVVVGATTGRRGRGVVDVVVVEVSVGVVVPSTSSPSQEACTTRWARTVDEA